MCIRTMPWLPLSALAVAAVLATVPAGCGGGDASAFEGTYQVVHHTRNQEGCDAQGPEVTDGDRYFQLKAEDFFGATILGYHTCTSPTDCEESSNLFRSFAKLDGQWRMETSTASTGDDVTCSLTSSIGSLTRTDTGVRIEIRTSRGEITLDGKECDTDLVDSNPEALSCEEYEVIEADLI